MLALNNLYLLEVGQLKTEDPSGDDRGFDSATDGTGEVRQPRMYQLVRQKGPIKDMTFEIEFLDPGVEAFSFTFG